MSDLDKKKLKRVAKAIELLRDISVDISSKREYLSAAPSLNASISLLRLYQYDLEDKK